MSASLTGFQTQTERLILRDIRTEDEPILASYFAESSAQPFILDSQKDPASVQVYVSAVSQPFPFEQRSHFLLALEIRDTGELAGVCTLNYAEPRSTYALLGWHLAQAHSGKGYATESGREALRLAFEQKAVRRVNSDCFAHNARAQQLLAKLGMQRHALSRLGKWWLSIGYGQDDAIVRYAIDSDAWHAHVRRGHENGGAQQSG
jgi:RimJ/RimL family protein N-acetyltransferase